ncbi:MAG: M23 family metallopeptidase [Gemmatimonadales bacterium]
MRRRFAPPFRFARVVTWLGICCALAWPQETAAQEAGVRVEWQPDRPRQGSLVQLWVAPDAAGRASPAVFAELAGEPLHFEPHGDGSLHALGAVPLGAADSVVLRVLRIRGGIVETSRTAIPVVTRRAPGERLRAAPRFTPPPDSALRARISREWLLARQVYRRTHRMPRLWHQPFLRPRDSRVTSPFGAGREVNGVWRSTHSGLDLAGGRGTPVRAANRGVVALIGDFFYGGTCIYLQHGAGLVTTYLHLSRATVARGDTVERGQIIGRVGATGRVTGPHLHWGAHYGQVAFDPADLLALPAPD